MKNERERTERVVAYLLGELGELDRVAFERELERDGALREEKERLEATIGLVRGALAEDAPGAEALSDVSQRRLMDAARAGRPAPRPAWYRSTALRVAASFVALFAVGVIATRALREDERSPEEPLLYETFGGGRSEGEMARATRSKTNADAAGEPREAKEEQQAAGRAARSPEDLRGLGYLSDDDAEPAQETPAGSSRRSDALSANDQEALRAIGYAEPSLPDDLGAMSLPSDPAGGASASTTGREKLGTRRAGPPRPRDESASPQAPASPGAAANDSGSSFFLGHGGKKAGELSEAEIERVQERYVRGELSAEEVNEILAGERESAPAKDQLDALGYFSHEDRRSARRRGLTADEILRACRRRPGESPSAMFFRFWGDNPFELTALDRLSTFAADVDTASYTLARRYLAEGRVPEKAQVRTEEFVNYFDAGVEPPAEETFRVALDLAPSRFGGDERERWMLRVVLKGREVADFERAPVALTFVVDTSGSMSRNDRLELVKTSLRLLLTQLDANDSIAIVAFSNEARLVLPMTSAANRDTIEMALSQLRPSGSTNAEAGLSLGYAHASDELTEGATNRVVLLSDGVANVGQTDQDRIARDVARFRDRGIYLNTVGVGFGNHDDVFLEQLADKGDGICDYVDTAIEARKAFVENFTGKIETIARDVKIQVEFDPGSVARYRLLGYENRAVADRDFRNDEVDAGEVGAGHEVTALYELELADLGDLERPLATVRVRWKAPHGQAPEGRDPERAFEIERHLAPADVATAFEGTPIGYRKAVLVAQFAELLRRSVHARGDSLDELIDEARRVAAEDGDREFAELVRLLERSRELILSRLPRHDELWLAIDAYRRNRFLHAQLEEVAAERDAAVLEELEERNRELELRIRELLER